MRKDPDYYTVMERTIKFYQSRYDPEGYFTEKAPEIIQEPESRKIKKKKDLLTFFFI